MPPKTSQFPREQNDFYGSPPGVITTLLRHVWLPQGKIWECAAGDGALVSQLEAEGREVVATDLVDRGDPRVTPRVDFLLERRLPDNVTIICTNPPFKLDFVRHGLDLGAEMVVMLLPWTWGGACGPERRALMNHCSDIVRLGRLRMLPPGASDSGHSGMKDFAWFVFRAEPQAATRIR